MPFTLAAFFLFAFSHRDPLIAADQWSIERFKSFP